jgi:hypothetical protein
LKAKGQSELADVEATIDDLLNSDDVDDVAVDDTETKQPSKKGAKKSSSSSAFDEDEAEMAAFRVSYR